MSTARTAPSDPSSLDFVLGAHYGSAFAHENAIEAVVQFANGDISPDVESRIRVAPSAKGQRGAGQDTQRAALLEQIKFHREYAVQMLQRAVEGSSALIEFVKSWPDLHSAIDLSLMPDVSFGDSGKPALRWLPRLGVLLSMAARAPNPQKETWITSGDLRVMLGPSWPSAAETWVNFAAVLIATSSEDDPIEIGCCALEQCGRFFQIVRRGRGKPSRRYCPGTDHMERAHAHGSTERSRIKRQRDARQRASAAANRRRRGK